MYRRMIVLYLQFVQVIQIQAGSPGHLNSIRINNTEYLLVPFSTYAPDKGDKRNEDDEQVVLINGFNTGLTILILVTSLPNPSQYPRRSFLHSHLYTEAYRIGLKHLSLHDDWLKENSPYSGTLQFWRKRLYYLNSFLPNWMRYLLPWVKNEDWKHEEEIQRKFLEIVPEYQEFIRGNDDNI